MGRVPLASHLSPRTSKAHKRTLLKECVRLCSPRGNVRQNVRSREKNYRFARFLNFGTFAGVREQANKCSLFAHVRRRGAHLRSAVVGSLSEGNGLKAKKEGEKL
jgi:hypothetical protein